jgi:hypothetical protein
MSKLDEFSEEELAALLQEIRRKRTGRKVDWDNMSDQERQNVNKTLQPMTNKMEHIEFPKMLYGMNNGQLVCATVGNYREEDILREKYAYDWRNSPLAHGIETAPESGHGVTPMPFTVVKTTNPQEAELNRTGLTPEMFAAQAVNAVEIQKRKRGRPPKDKAVA